MSATEDRQGQGPADVQAYQSIQLWMDVVNKMYHLSEAEWEGRLQIVQQFCEAEGKDPDEIIAEAEIAKKVSKYVPPDYVRYQQFDDVRVAHYVRRQIPYGHHTPLPGSASGIAIGGQTRTPSAAIPRQTPATRQSPAEQSPPRRQRPIEVPPIEPSVAADDAVSADVPADDEEWIWTGTDLVRKTPQDSDSTDG